MKKSKKYRKYVKWSLWTILALLVIRICFFQVMKVGDFHMSSTLLPGDRVIVNKFRAGLRLPISFIGLPGVNAPYADGIRLPYLRLPALKSIQRQDVIVFNKPAGTDKPIDRKQLMISRVIGLPGDTVLIKDKIVYINNKVVNPPVSARTEYRVITSGKPIGDDFIRKYDLEKPRLIADIGIYDVDLPVGVNTILEKVSGIKTVRETKQFPNDASTNYFPESNFFKWNRDQFGPFLVPSKGATVTIDLKSIDFYRNIIEISEGHDVSVDYAGAHVDGHLVTSYTFKKDYYFILSDDRDNPDDSRVIGFVPADHLVGTARRVIWSQQSKYDYSRKFRPGRILKKIR